MTDRRQKGTDGENAAAAFLKEQGVRILIRNYHCHFGEIDLIGRDGGYLIVVEVKRRDTLRQGFPGEAVHTRKQRTICRVFDHFRMRYGIDEYTPVRFDVVEVGRGLDCRWIRDAFEYH